jgi:FkbM family methyltransferase
MFVDVGANVGLHTLAAARAMQGRGSIVAFEPFAPTKALLEKTIWMNGFAGIVSIHQAAVSNQSGNQDLFLGETSGHHSLLPLTTSDSLSSRAVTVPTIRLCDVIGSNEVVTLLKIDVEGAELDVLEGSKPVIQNNPDIALIVEFGPSHLSRHGYETQHWLSAFADLGLAYRAINEQTGKLQEWPIRQLEAAESVNLFFSRPNSKAWAKVATDT